MGKLLKTLMQVLAIAILLTVAASEARAQRSIYSLNSGYAYGYYVNPYGGGAYSYYSSPSVVWYYNPPAYRYYYTPRGYLYLYRPGYLRYYNYPGFYGYYSPYGW